MTKLNLFSGWKVAWPLGLPDEATPATFMKPRLIELVELAMDEEYGEYEKVLALQKDGLKKYKKKKEMQKKSSKPSV